ncbi:hypothetical protein JOC83_001300 [Bacillus iocasae]|uniref:Fatty acid hydroxylase domain-containing protein n=2 Tax=Priestia iocasae TaxID=2291674 RepID=A0ABS2QUS0_9BACI|nr:hypothetical protein [Metabacillus iocasae]
MGKYVKEFFSHLDVLAMFVLSMLSMLGFIDSFFRSYVWLVFLSGVVTYITSEYMTHRFLFHMKPPKHPLFLKFMKRIHYDHHEFPDDLKLLFLPIWYSFPQMVAVSLVVGLISNSTYGFAMFTGLSLALLYYEWVHYVAHRPIKPKTAFGKWMKKVHLWHHFKNEHYWFGVTNPTLDYMMGTFKDEREVEKSETARKL